MNEPDLGFLDTNILVYAYDTQEKTKHKIAKEIVSSVFMRKNKATVSAQVLSEFFVVITKKIKQPLSIDDVYDIICDILDFDMFLKIDLPAMMVLEAIKISDQFQTSYWDGLIATTMKSRNIRTIYTEDEKGFRNIPQIEVVNPFL